MSTTDFRRREVGVVAFLAAAALLVPLMAGCSKSTPACDSGKVMDGVIYAVGQDIRKNLSGIAAMGGPGMELSDDEWRTIRSGMIITVENIKEQGFDEASGQRTCAGNVTITRSGKKETMPVAYFAEIDKTSGELKTTISASKGKENEGNPLQTPQ